MSEKAIYRNPFNRKQRTLIKWPAKKALEQYFLMQNKPSIIEIAGLAESLQLDNKVVRVWFYNRRQKEKSSRTCTTSTSIIRMVPVEPNHERVGESLATREISQHRHGVDSFGNFLSNANVRRFSLGKPNGMTQQRRTVLVLGNRGLVHQKFINQLINYIVNVKEDDKFRFQLVDEHAGNSGQTNCISVYDIHHADGFRIPYSLTIVVVSYSGDSADDSGQLFRDQKVAVVFNRFLEEKNGIQELDMICNLVINNTNDNHRRPFLSIFGNDVADNINNWELTESFVSDSRSWNTVIQHFFSVLSTMKPKSLILTKLVLEERKKLEGIMEMLQSLVTSVLAKMEELNNAKELIQYYQWQVELINKKVHSLSLDNLKRESPVTEYEMNFNSDQNINSHQDYHVAEMKWKASIFKGQNLVKTLETDLLRSGTSMQDNFHLTWRSIQWLNSVALHGNSLFSQKIFDILSKAEELLKQIGF
ncbi:uncharacterized protein LOC124198736 [Daphnia pulex]|nr:uncharacterized protein LOC124198736 [Daphnia pulex]